MNFALDTPSRMRRFACQLYELMLLFGIVFIAGYLFDTLTQSRHALMHRHERQAWLFLVLGLYFVWFWRRGGQTLAMKTWKIQLKCLDGTNVSYQQAMLRYLLCWPLTLSGLGLVWSFFDPSKQYLQDRLCKTQLKLTV
jgi:uncharacterized RDD family membrane protein YckC